MQRYMLVGEIRFTPRNKTSSKLSFITFYQKFRLLRPVKVKMMKIDEDRRWKKG